MACRLGKMKKLTVQLGSGIKSQILGEVISVDGVPVSSVVSIEGYVGWFFFIEESCGFEYSYGYKDKTELVEAVESLRLLLFSHAHKMRYLQFDAGSVEMSKETGTILMSKQIIS